MKAIFSIFPKFYSKLTVEQLAALVRECGLDTTNMVIRDGYWVTGRDLAVEVPAFVKAMEREGIQIHFCTAGYPAEQILKDDSCVKVLADHGIRAFRMGYFRGDVTDVAGAMETARRQMERIADVCARTDIKVIYQVHHGTLFPTATGAFYLTRGLPARSVGVELDPGNQAFEGMENWRRSARLLGPMLAAVGMKDVAWTRDPAKAAGPGKGWSRTWAALDEGITDWYELCRSLREIDFDGTLVWMPFYSTDDLPRMTAILKREVAYIRKVVADVCAEKTPGSS
jgi:sugar phosphate isomerase/epimerase